MPSQPKILGILRPLGGGDPVPFTKDTLTVGRRSNCDVCLDFENVSGRHCQFQIENGVWKLRDLNSSNGTTINGTKVTGPTGVMPDMEIGIASHLFRLDYEPTETVGVGVGDAAIDDGPQFKSLLEMAGLESDDKPVRSRPIEPPRKIDRVASEVADFDDPVPDDVKIEPPARIKSLNDDDFFDLIKDDVRKPS